MCCDVEWFGKVSWLMIRCVLWLVGEIGKEVGMV